ncbi:MAG: NAD(P)H-dependent oxidoreductase [Pseudomonadota bacterium]
MPHNLSSSLLDLFRKRHACHQFREEAPIDRQTLDTILEAGRLSPSSFGLEHWKFVVLTRPEDKAAMQAACFQQPQVGSAAALVVILAKLAELEPDHPYARKLLEREYPGDAFAGALANYRSFFAATDLKAWSVTQCHIAAANMMTAATGLGLDSCAIGGFLADQVQTLLDLDAGRYEVALVLALGHCAHDPAPKQRLPLAELVDYR